MLSDFLGSGTSIWIKSGLTANMVILYSKRKNKLSSFPKYRSYNMCQISQKYLKETFQILMKNRHLGRSLQFSASLLALPSTTPSSETNHYIINFKSVTILNYTIIFVSIALILSVKNSRCIIDCIETDC